jgi:hypothetical protein
MPAKVPIKTGPEIVDFRPVPYSLAALANRRLQPLGHLTALKLLAILTIYHSSIRLCSSLCSSSLNVRFSAHLDSGSAESSLSPR